MNSEEKAKRNREHVKRWKEKNPEKVKEQQRRYHLRHQEQRKLYFREKYHTMRDKAKAFDELTKGGREE